MTITREVLEEGYALARGILGPLAGAPVSTITGYVSLFERMRDAELRLEAARWKLIGLDAAGLATSGDFDAYDNVRRNIFASTRRIVDPFRSWLSATDARAAARVPTPQLAPAVTPGSGRQLLAQQSAQQQGRTQGLGNPLLAGGAVVGGAGAWMICGLILAIIAALALVVIGVAVTAVMVRDSIIAEKQTEQLRMLYENRKQVYDDCRASGGSPEGCAQTAARLVPVPNEALVPNDNGAGWSWIGWTAAAAALIALVGAGVYVYTNERGFAPNRARNASFRGGVDAHPRRIRARAGKRARRNYDLDVED